MIEGSTLDAKTKERALAVFWKLAQAEGAVHAMPPEDVTFHEVGAVDSIVDIVGCAIGLGYLGVTKVISSPLSLGRGFVRCQHGRMPVPAPATLECLQGVPVAGTSLPFELVTPTGAAIIAALADEFSPIPAFVIDRVGYGAGSRTLPDRPNLVRLLLGQPSAGAHTQPKGADCLQLETNIDDQSPELLAYITSQLLDAGALDVWTAAITMKKGRLAHKLSLLCLPEQREQMEALLFRESSTLGVRHFPVSRTMLQREQQEVETAYGPITIKVGRDQQAWRTMSPEFEVCRRIAQTQDVPLKEVYAAAISAWQAQQSKRSTDQNK